MVSSKPRIDSFEKGTELELFTISIDGAQVQAYQQAVGSTTKIYEQEGWVPPHCVLAKAFGHLFELTDLPDGSVHGAQKIEPKDSIKQGKIDIVITLSKKGVRHGMNTLVFLFQGRQENASVLEAETTLFVPVGAV